MNCRYVEEGATKEMTKTFHVWEEWQGESDSEDSYSLSEDLETEIQVENVRIIVETDDPAPEPTEETDLEIQDTEEQKQTVPDHRENDAVSAHQEPLKSISVDSSTSEKPVENPDKANSDSQTNAEVKNIKTL